MTDRIQGVNNADMTLKDQMWRPYTAEPNKL